MTDKTHQLIGLTLATQAVFSYHQDITITWPVVGLILVGSALGSLAPDIDQPSSNIWDIIPLGDIAGKITSKALGGHRNLSHSLLGIVVFCGLASFVSTHWIHSTVNQIIFFQSFTIGYIAHLIADSVTVVGIPLFWPFGHYVGIPPKPFEGLRIETGKWFENLIIFPLVFSLFVIIIMNNYRSLCVLFGKTC